MRLAAVLAAALASAACSTAPFESPPKPGVGRYTYTVKEVAPGQADTGYRVAFDIETTAGPTMTAVVRSAETLSNNAWKPATVDAACAAALKARPGELARIKLFALTKEESAMGPAFMATCAPPAIFFPMTDILNVALIMASPEFGAATLKQVGEARRFPAFSTSVDRPDTFIDARAPGGDIRLTALEPTRATLEWTADPMAVHVIHRMPGTGDVSLSGTERFGFRLDLDPRTGALIRAATPSDVLDVTIQIPGLPPGAPAPRMQITRNVTIDPR